MHAKSAVPGQAHGTADYINLLIIKQFHPPPSHESGRKAGFQGIWGAQVSYANICISFVINNSRDSVALLRHPWVGVLQSMECSCRPFGPTGRFRLTAPSKRALPSPPIKNSRSRRDQLHSFLRRRRDSNPRDVAAQQFSRLPPSTTRPHLRKVDKGKNFVRKVNLLSRRISTGTGSGRSHLP